MADVLVAHCSTVLCQRASAAARGYSRSTKRFQLARSNNRDLSSSDLNVGKHHKQKKKGGPRSVGRSQDHLYPRVRTFCACGPVAGRRSISQSGRSNSVLPRHRDEPGSNPISYAYPSTRDARFTATSRLRTHFACLSRFADNGSRLKRAVVRRQT